MNITNLVVLGIALLALGFYFGILYTTWALRKPANTLQIERAFDSGYAMPRHHALILEILNDA